MQRRKGATGEREVCTLIRDHLGIEAHRSWQGQAACGGEDIASIPGYSIEVKFAAASRLIPWWDQAQEQALKAKAIPALIWRITGHGRGLDPLEKWRVRLPLYAVTSDAPDDRAWCELSLGAWFDLLRERMK